MNEHSACSSLNIRVKLERSSLGTPQARRERARITDGDAEAIVTRAAAYPAENYGRDLGGQQSRLHLYQEVIPIKPQAWSGPDSRERCSHELS